MQQVVLAALVRRDGGWQLPPAAAAGLTQRLDAMARQSAHPTAEVQQVLKLVVALRAQPGSQGAAADVVAALRQAPAVYDLLRAAKLGVGARGRHDRARFSAFEGRRGGTKAPVHDAPIPQGTLPARQLMRPLDRAAVKAKRR